MNPNDQTPAPPAVAATGADGHTTDDQQESGPQRREDRSGDGGRPGLPAVSPPDLAGALAQLEASDPADAASIADQIAATLAESLERPAAEASD